MPKAEKIIEQWCKKCKKTTNWKNTVIYNKPEQESAQRWLEGKWYKYGWAKKSVYRCCSCGHFYS